MLGFILFWGGVLDLMLGGFECERCVVVYM